MDGIRAAGAPYDPDGPRWLPCYQGTRWCGWSRMSNSAEQWERATQERREHEEVCGAGGSA